MIIKWRVRHVPADWVHPKTSNGEDYPIFDVAYDDAFRAWTDKAVAQVIAGGEAEPAPFPELYRVKFENEAICYQVYAEDEYGLGRPVSPVLHSRGAVGEWLGTLPAEWEWAGA